MESGQARYQNLQQASEQVTLLKPHTRLPTQSWPTSQVVQIDKEDAQGIRYAQTDDE